MTALVDTNVLVAAAVVDHPHRGPALAVLERPSHYSVSAHSLLELYNTLTKPRGYGWSPDRAWVVVRQMGAVFDVLVLTATEQLEAIDAFAHAGGIGAGLYDYVIGRVAVHRGIDTIITLNSKHFVPLFPDLTILTPTQYLESL